MEDKSPKSPKLQMSFLKCTPMNRPTKINETTHVHKFQIMQKSLKTGDLALNYFRSLKEMEATVSPRTRDKSA